MIDIRRADTRYRGGDRQAGIDTRHAFSFSGHYDPDNTGFGLLTAVNDERLEPGAGFGEHRHRDTEIVTWMVEGALEHRDSTGAAGTLRPGQVQSTGSGAGILHTERNAHTGPTRFLQMWLHPDRHGGPPRHDRADVTLPQDGGLVPVASGRGHAGAVALRQADAVLHAARLGEGGTAALPRAPFVYVHVVRGALRLGEEPLGEGDAARITGCRDLEVAGAEGGGEVLVWEMHAEPSYG
ncbi:pirin family protein [Streptomyces sp. NPDC059506]|uniref:pirin family protein n=1 Tax=Streptomyces sp. NPDC059506 TaxID=3347751 RepID=UPI0036BD8A04